jgi:SAM-dependent methyltransferase
MNHEQFLRDFEEFKRQSAIDGRFNPLVEEQNAILNDDADQTIHVSFDYWVHTAWAARKVAELKPYCHADFASYVYFAGIVSAFVPRFWFFDVRPVTLPLAGMNTAHADLTNLKDNASNTYESVSCLHVMEHVGLGRYGDKLDASGDRKAASELSRILAPGGRLLMVLPMNEKPRVHFNAHRFYSMAQVDEMFSGLRRIETDILHGGAVSHNTWPLNDDYTACMVFEKPAKAVSA